MAKFYKSVAWLEPYMESAKHLVDVGRVSTVKGFKVALHKNSLVYGTCSPVNGNKRSKYYNINLLTHETVSSSLMQTYFEQTGFSSLTAAQILQCFAHELAHVKHWEHTPEHGILEARIWRAFAVEAKRRGAKDMWIKVSPYLRQTEKE